MGSEYNKIKISNEILSCVKNERPSIAIKKISNLNNSNGNKIGSNNALKLYSRHADLSVNYESDKYKNNISNYVIKVNNNKTIAKKAISK
jgi:hypothetical protein